MAGYSGTPLVKKLGIKPRARARFVNPPEAYETLLELPEGVRFSRTTRGPLDFIQLFVRRESELTRRLPALKRAMTPDGMLWVSWPKRSSPLAGDLDENAVRAIGLEAGLVDVKVCAVDEDWSGLKFVYRIRDRAAVR